MFPPAEHMTRDADTTDISAFLAGNREALDRLVLRHQDRIYNLCCRLLGDQAEAEECAQETFVKVFRSLGNFRLESSFSTWLYTIAVNTCKNRRSSAENRFWKRILRLNPGSNDEEETPELDIEDLSPSPLAQLEEKEQQVRIQKAIDSLPDDGRTVIVLRHIEELSYEEICEITGYNLGTLKSKLARARLLLQEEASGRVTGESPEWNAPGLETSFWKTRNGTFRGRILLPWRLIWPNAGRAPLCAKPWPNNRACWRRSPGTRHRPGLLQKVRREVEKPSLLKTLNEKISSVFGPGRFLQLAATTAVALIVVGTLRVSMQNETTQTTPVAPAPVPALQSPAPFPRRRSPNRP